MAKAGTEPPPDNFPDCAKMGIFNRVSASPALVKAGWLCASKTPKMRTDGARSASPIGRSIKKRWFKVAERLYRFLRSTPMVKDTSVYIGRDIVHPTFDKVRYIWEAGRACIGV